MRGGARRMSLTALKLLTNRRPFCRQVSCFDLGSGQSGSKDRKWLYQLIIWCNHYKSTIEHGCLTPNSFPCEIFSPPKPEAKNGVFYLITPFISWVVTKEKKRERKIKLMIMSNRLWCLLRLAATMQNKTRGSHSMKERKRERKKEIENEGKKEGKS